MEGIKFLMKDGTWDYYDPVREEDFVETEDKYVINMAYTYEIEKKDVVSWEWYKLEGHNE